MGLRRLEDAIHSVIIRRLTPEWLPFLPGASYWVPPKKLPPQVLDVIGMAAQPLSDEEFLSMTTVRGWPSSSYYVDGKAPRRIKPKAKEATESEDDEGNTSSFNIVFRSFRMQNFKEREKWGARVIITMDGKELSTSLNPARSCSAQRMSI
ncbi:hypothetical protein H6P81_009196 [Aristolochia fimbriata]|uniref:Uncharacterized protein n=1 Tax=Aristolochia fimbriata TaxID=158543 RepID=A0AAV7EMW8_ARIFI|nr:hypothetical protein H6P81_009196 [Aristolochia fimbriata]